ncbi:uncharacterized protein LOC107646769 [Arachis ipaensis]|uniref:uncharacterized protein LOC107646769 n=1 Tax=Arachis ipaensis TaxID=130454 RepID=UPI0007AF1EC1|nr:uncharacterized protein LOC107646769 [Arachis ipaensis]
MVANNEYFYSSERQEALKKVAERPTNALPSDTIPNPKEECKEIQLRSGKTLENNKEANKKPAEDDKANSKEEVPIKEKDQEELRKKDGESQASKKEKQVMIEPPQEQRKEVKHYIPPLPYPHKLQRELKDQQFPKFLEVFKKLKINIPLAEVLEQMHLYAKFLKELINKKRSWNEKETVILTQECSAVIQKGSSINLMPLSMMRKLSIEEVKPIRMTLELADRSMMKREAIPSYWEDLS